MYFWKLKVVGFFIFFFQITLSLSMIHRARCGILKTSYGTIILDSEAYSGGYEGLAPPPTWVKSLDFMGFQAPTGAEPPLKRIKV